MGPLQCVLILDACERKEGEKELRLFDELVTSGSGEGGRSHTINGLIPCPSDLIYADKLFFEKFEKEEKGWVPEDFSQKCLEDKIIWAMENPGRIEFSNVDLPNSFAIDGFQWRLNNWGMKTDFIIYQYEFLGGRIIVDFRAYDRPPLIKSKICCKIPLPVRRPSPSLSLVA